MIIELPRIVLASASPRRAEILRTVGWPFEALPVDIDEARRADEHAVDYVQRLAREKADAAASRVPVSIIIAADTTVTIDNHILEKPADEPDATRMLQLLNNRWHRVLTGIAIINRETSRTIVAREETEVKFAAMSDGEIDWYVKTGEPMDKAGAYAIQGGAASWASHVEGEYSNVVGLPLPLVSEMLRANGLIP